MDPRQASLFAALNAAVTHQNAGRLAEAEKLYRHVLAQMPRQPDALHLLGVVLHRQGRNGEARRPIEQAIRTMPNAPDYHASLGIVLAADGSLAAAEASFRRALDLDPKLAPVWSNLAGVLRRLGRLDEAEEALRTAAARAPASAEPLLALAGLCRARGRLGEAEDAAREALDLGESPPALNMLGTVLLLRGEPAEAEDCFRRALAREPGAIDPAVNLGTVLRETGRLAEALETLTDTAARAPANAPAQLCLGAALLEAGRPSAAGEAFDAALAASPDDAGARSNRVMGGAYDPAAGAADLLRAAQAFGAAMPPAEPCPAGIPDPDKRLRVGLVSGDLRMHPIGIFLREPLAHFDRDRFEVVCYANQAVEDDVTDAIRRRAALWREAFGLSDASLAELIRDDDVDILIDLSGHSALNRLPVFARRAAPVQMSWLGFPGTTGVPAMDWLLTDARMAPAGTEGQVTERLLRLPDVAWGYAPHPMPLPGPLPALAAGHVTFASFSNPAKLSEPVLAAWATLLARVPSARLLLKYRGLDDPLWGEQLERLAPGRVERAGWSTREATLEAYGRVDIALDPFPFGGGTTACDALWMGVPVVTRHGATMPGRVAESFLAAVGLDDLVARDADDYVERAAALAADLPRLAELRRSLRDRMQESPICDPARFAHSLEQALRTAWRDYCASTLRR